MTTTIHRTSSDSPFTVGRDGTTARAVRAELTKLRTVRSTWTICTLSFVAALGLAALNGLSTRDRWDTMSPVERAEFDPASNALIGVLFSALVLGALAVRSITNEYSTGMIRSTLAALPARSSVLAAKAGLLATVTFTVTLASNIPAVLVGRSILQDVTAPASLTDTAVMRAVVYGAISVSAFALIGLALGTIFRRASIANVLLSVAVIGGQLVGTALPASAQRFLPFNALQATVSTTRLPELLTPVHALLMLLGYAIVALLAAGIALARRDV